MEAIYEFFVEDMPVTVAVDSQGNSIHNCDHGMKAIADLSKQCCWLRSSLTQILQLFILILFKFETLTAPTRTCQNYRNTSRHNPERSGALIMLAYRYLSAPRHESLLPKAAVLGFIYCDAGRYRGNIRRSFHSNDMAAIITDRDSNC